MTLREVEKICKHIMNEIETSWFFYRVPLYIFLLIISSDHATLFQSYIRTALDSVVYKHTTEICSSDCFPANPGTHWVRSLTCCMHIAFILWAETVKLFSGERKFLDLPVMLIFGFYTGLSKVTVCRAKSTKWHELLLRFHSAWYLWSVLW